VVKWIWCAVGCVGDDIQRPTIMMIDKKKLEYRAIKKVADKEKEFWCCYKHITARLFLFFAVSCRGDDCRGDHEVEGIIQMEKS